ERLLSGTGKIELDPSKDLYSQTQSTPDMWRTGTVETKSFTADGSKATFSLEVPTANLDDFSSWSVKVNGKGYKVITDQSKWEALASD
ncbi:hypothetical protein ABTK66_18800, partial [Acinetobacter baumannii]